MLSKIVGKWKSLIVLMNSKGVPMPTIRDPKTGIGSVSLTLVFVSSIMVIIGLIGKWSKSLGEIDVNSALQFFYASAALYFGRNLKGKGGAEISGPGDQPASAQPDAGRSQDS